MPTRAAGQELARQMVEVGHRLDRSVSVLLSDMDQPLGEAVGHSLEVAEAIAALKGQGPADLMEVVLTLGAMQLQCAGRLETLDEGKALLTHQINSGKALLKLRELISVQGGDENVVDQPELMPQAAHQTAIIATASGYVLHLDAYAVGEAVRVLGGGRLEKDDVLDLGVGVKLLKKRGEAVSAGETLATLYYNDTAKLELAKHSLTKAYDIGAEAPAPAELIGDIIWAK